MSLLLLIPILNVSKLPFSLRPSSSDTPPLADSKAGSDSGSSSSGDSGGQGRKKSSKAGVIAGSVVGSVVGLGLLVGAFFLYRRLSKRPNPEAAQNVESDPVSGGPAELGGVGKTAEELSKPELDSQEKPPTELLKSELDGQGPNGQGKLPAEVSTANLAMAELGPSGPSPVAQVQELSAVASTQPQAAELPNYQQAYPQNGLGVAEMSGIGIPHEMPAGPYSGVGPGPNPEPPPVLPDTNVNQAAAPSSQIPAPEDAGQWQAYGWSGPGTTEGEEENMYNTRCTFT